MEVGQPASSKSKICLKKPEASPESLPRGTKGGAATGT